MHELAVTQNVLDIAVQKAKESGACKITGIKLVIGEISSFVDDSVQFYFDILSRDTIASGASLKFERIPLQVRCRKCSQAFFPGLAAWVCPQCGECDAEVIAGRELYLDSIEVE